MLTPLERKATFSLALIFAFRMLGLFMILPVFTLYGTALTGATPKLLGVALGIYGLTQASLQIPFGLLADRFGRKQMITLGLILFALGSVIAAEAHTIQFVILGRALQGASAIGSVLLTLLADLTQEKNRTKAMALMGMTIGLSFMLAMLIGPIVTSMAGLSGLFWLTAAFALCGLAILYGWVPTPQQQSIHRETETIPAQLLKTLSNSQLFLLNLSILALHAILTASFIVLPLILTQSGHIEKQQQWMVYLPVLLLAFFMMFPFIFIAEKKHHMRSVFLGAILCLLVTQGFFAWQYDSLTIVIICLLFFMAAFTLLEAMLPSLISKIAPAGDKGTAMGIYSTSQFLGIFIGGSLGGFLFAHHGILGIFLGNTCIALCWIIVIFFMKEPSYLTTYLLRIASMNETQVADLTRKLQTFKGVADVVIIPNEKIAYLKVDNEQVDEAALEQFATTLH